MVCDVFAVWYYDYFSNTACWVLSTELRQKCKRKGTLENFGTHKHLVCHPLSAEQISSVMSEQEKANLVLLRCPCHYSDLAKNKSNWQNGQCLLQWGAWLQLVYSGLMRKLHTVCSAATQHAEQGTNWGSRGVRGWGSFEQSLQCKRCRWKVPAAHVNVTFKWHHCEMLS